MTGHPTLLHTVLDATDARGLAEFYRQLMGLVYRQGDEDAHDWFVLLTTDGTRVLAVQQVDELPRSTWPRPGVPQQLHLDLTVPSTAELDRQHERALALGAQLLLDRRDDPEEPLYVYADPAGHPFCLFLAPR
ncbi:VOC family protein [Pseudonocardia sp. CA-107938]|uniref:VOC family protein n=1 Tax=Pseudonocardia sp. CA-107938 TaxID=3240021 RepID=UPI003D90E049